MIITLDVSASVEITFNKEDSHRFREILMQSELVLAPDTFPPEISYERQKFVEKKSSISRSDAVFLLSGCDQKRFRIKKMCSRRPICYVPVFPSNSYGHR
jgi:hypothetical protein